MGRLANNVIPITGNTTFAVVLKNCRLDCTSSCDFFVSMIIQLLSLYYNSLKELMDLSNFSANLKTLGGFEVMLIIYNVASPSINA